MSDRKEFSGYPEIFPLTGFRFVCDWALAKYYGRKSAFCWRIFDEFRIAAGVMVNEDITDLLSLA